MRPIYIHRNFWYRKILLGSFWIDLSNLFFFLLDSFILMIFFCFIFIVFHIRHISVVFLFLFIYFIRFSSSLSFFYFYNINPVWYTNRKKTTKLRQKMTWIDFKSNHIRMYIHIYTQNDIYVMIVVDFLRRGKIFDDTNMAKVSKVITFESVLWAFFEPKAGKRRNLWPSILIYSLQILSFYEVCANLLKI